MAVDEADCPKDSLCHGYKLGGAYNLGENSTKTITSPAGEPLLQVHFELSMPEVNPDHKYQIAFGFENGPLAESCSFVRQSDGDIRFSSAYEKGSLIETRTNKVKTTADFATWTGEATFDQPKK